MRILSVGRPLAHPSIDNFDICAAPFGNGFFFSPLYCITDVREMTLSDPSRESSVINASVMPSAKMSSSGLPDMFVSGSTASERTCNGVELPNNIRLPPGAPLSRAKSTNATNKAAATIGNPNRRSGKAILFG